MLYTWIKSKKCTVPPLLCITHVSLIGPMPLNLTAVLLQQFIWKSQNVFHLNAQHAEFKTGD